MTEAHEENWTKEESNSAEDTPMVPINKLGQYFESDDSNAIIPISYHQRRVEAILDGGARVSIMTKQCWEKWGSPHMEKTLLVVKLVDGTTTRPVGVVKDLKVKTFGITYHVWFVVMDIKNPIDSYDIILGRPFLRTAGVVHDWSSNTLYLRKDTSVTKVDLMTWKSRPLVATCLLSNQKQPLGQQLSISSKWKMRR